MAARKKSVESDAPQGTGQLPACEPTGWPNVEAQGEKDSQPFPSTYRNTRGGFPFFPAPAGKGGRLVVFPLWISFRACWMQPPRRRNVGVRPR